MFCIGEILKTKGNNGEVVLRTSPDFICRRDIGSIHLKSKKHKKNLIIEKIIESGNYLNIKFIDINTITEAYKLIGYSAYLEDQDEIKTFKKDNLVDYTVIDIDGNHWGKVINDIEEGLTHILEVDDNDDIIFIPYSNDTITEINKKKKTIFIDTRSGLRTSNK